MLGVHAGDRSIAARLLFIKHCSLFSISRHIIETSHLCLTNSAANARRGRTKPAPSSPLLSKRFSSFLGCYLRLPELYLGAIYLSSCETSHGSDRPYILSCKGSRPILERISVPLTLSNQCPVLSRKVFSFLKQLFFFFHANLLHPMNFLKYNRTQLRSYHTLLITFIKLFFAIC